MKDAKHRKIVLNYIEQNKPNALIRRKDAPPMIN
jgi:hypothetical protein